jgi:peptide-methionine (S)-S-oxide reductase
MRQILAMIGLTVAIGCGTGIEVVQAQTQRDTTKVGTKPGDIGTSSDPLATARERGNELAAFAQGCFWCYEPFYRATDGVIATAVGYTGGHLRRPTYQQVCTGATGHAEAVLIEYDPKKVSYEKLLEIFWTTHDPTTRDRQGPDVGSQYRSAIFYFSPEQAQAARASMLKAQPAWKDPIVTEIIAASEFWIAEEYHQQYYEKRGIKSGG